MKTQLAAQVLRIYVGEQDQFKGGPLYAQVVARLKEAGVSGVTVLHGIEGFGAHKSVHTARFLHSFEGLPVVIEAVDEPENITIALALLDELLTEALVTVQNATAIRYSKE
jgi:PII-like signaling protein